MEGGRVGDRGGTCQQWLCTQGNIQLCHRTRFRYCRYTSIYIILSGSNDQHHKGYLQEAGLESSLGLGAQDGHSKK